MSWHSPKDVMPWVGLYVAVASLFCTLAMAADIFQGLRQRKLWFPCRFFTINAASTTIIAITMKLPVDLTTDLPDNNEKFVKPIGIYFLFTMLANFLPCLGGMDDNVIALGILIVTVIANMCIQMAIEDGLVASIVEISITIFFLLWPLWVALTVPVSRRVLEHQYKELHVPDLNRQEIKFSSMELIHHVKKYWMMAETGNPQFVLASSPFCSASGLVCLYFAVISINELIQLFSHISNFWDGQSEYKWSINVILAMQSIGVVVGSIAPISRCIITISYFDLSKEWTIHHINIFRVEKHWTQRLQQWKHRHVTSYIPGRHCKKIFNNVKNMILSYCIALQITVVVTCKTICLVPTILMILFYSCCHLCNSLLKRFKQKPNASNNDAGSEIEEYTNYVIQIEDEVKFSNRLLRNMLRYITKLLHKSEKEQPKSLMKFLEKSTGFNGVAEFDSDHVLPFYEEETHNCWSLVTVTLTAIAIAIALPNIANGHVNELLVSLREGLQFVQHVEETLDQNGDLAKARKTARRVWTEVEVYCTWLQIDLQKKARKGSMSKEILQWLADEAVKIMVQFKRKKKRSVHDPLHNFIAASSMYGISQTILLHCNEQEDWPTDGTLFEWISCMIADILCACFTNLPRVITLKCHHKAIEKREESIRTAARLLGKSKRILNILGERQLPDLDLESMAYIDKWHALLKSQVPNVSASSSRIQPASLSSNGSLKVTIM